VSAPPTLTVIAGPTAAGKSALAIDIAQRNGAEIISADSQAVYRLFEIGTAKPDAAALARVPHHLVSVADPLEQFTAARFQALADAAIEDIAARGRRVLVVGGTGLYIRVLLHGLSAGPSDAELRARLEEDARRLGPEALHARLTAVDPPSAEKIAVSDTLRVVRALEIHTLTGEPASAAWQSHGFASTRYPYTLWFLDPPREALAQAISARTQAMFARGLIEEVHELVRRGYREAAAMGSLGYRQALAVVEGRLGLLEAVAETERLTRAYAKRQRTWFRREPGVRFLAPPYVELSGLSQ
jgi:tRNA dimethylallyltransferase